FGRSRAPAAASRQRSTWLLKFDGPPGTSTGRPCGRVTVRDGRLGETRGTDRATGGAGAPPSCGGGVNGDGTDGATPGNWPFCARAGDVASRRARTMTRVMAGSPGGRAEDMGAGASGGQPVPPPLLRLRAAAAVVGAAALGPPR